MDFDAFNTQLQVLVTQYMESGGDPILCADTLHLTKLDVLESMDNAMDIDIQTDLH